MADKSSIGSALISVGGQIVNGMLQNHANNKAIAESERSRAYNTWLTQNSPILKSAGMRQAGLNPAFENGSQMGSTPSPSYPNIPSTIQPLDPMTLSNIQLMKSQEGVNDADKDLKEQEAERERIKNEYLPALMRSEVNLNTSSYVLNISKSNLSNEQAKEVAQNISESEMRCGKIVGEMNILRKQVDILTHEEKIKSIEASFKSAEMKAIISNYMASAKLSEAQANDIVKTFVYRMYGVVSEAELNQERKNEVYWDSSSKKLHFDLDNTYSEPERIIGIVNGSVDALQGAGDVVLKYLPAGKAAKLAGGLKQVKHLK